MKDERMKKLAEEMELYYVDCEREEQEKRECEMEERRKVIDGMKRYQEMGIPVYIDDKIPEEDDWEKIIAIRSDHRFYQADYIMEEVEVEELPDAEQLHVDVADGRTRITESVGVAESRLPYGGRPTKQVLKAICWNLRYHGDLMPEPGSRKAGGKRRK